MAKLSGIGKALLGYLGIRAAKVIVEDQIEAHRRRKANERFCGYPWSQVTTILTQCCTSHEELRTFLKSDPPPQERDFYVQTILTMSPAAFRVMFGFDRPPPD